MTINSGLTTLTNNISNIISSIRNKGQSVSISDTLDSYKEKILRIPNKVKREILLCPEVIEGDIKEIIDTTSSVLRIRCFCDCQYLESASFFNIRKINSFAFEKCFRLNSLYLYSKKMVHLVDRCAFRYTPLEKLTEKCGIYVPPELYEQYIGDENWKYFRPIIKLIGSELIKTQIVIMGANSGYDDDDYYFI